MGLRPKMVQCRKEGCTCPLNAFKIDIVTPNFKTRTELCPCHMVELWLALQAEAEAEAKMPPVSGPAGQA